jgi:tripartite-type tricarboxylate transporter receptor subunit TctC
VLSSNWFGFSTAVGIAPAIVERWRVAIGAALAEPRIVARFAGIGVVPGAMGPAEYSAFIASELVRWRGVIQAAGVRAE